MGELMNIRKARILSAILATGFLVVHIILLIIFFRTGVKPMAYFNIFSVCFYLMIHLVIAKGWFRAYVISVFLEVLVHMSLAVYFTGWDGNFQVTLIGICILMAYSEYAGRTLKVKYLKSMPMWLALMLVYIGLCVLSHFHEAPYSLSPEICFGLQLFWGFVVFVVMISFLLIFVNQTVGAEEFLTKEVGHDQLTGLPNRYFMSDYLNNISDNTGLQGYFAAMLDIDDFKKINDTYGHNGGDYILKELALFMQSGADDFTLCRWGGEEFLIVGKYGGDMNKVFNKVDALRKRIADRKFVFEGKEIKVTVTVGLAAYRTGSNLRAWIGAADQRLYDGKALGKNMVAM